MPSPRAAEDPAAASRDGLTLLRARARGFMLNELRLNVARARSGHVEDELVRATREAADTSSGKEGEEGGNDKEDADVFETKESAASPGLAAST